MARRFRKVVRRLERNRDACVFANPQYSRVQIKQQMHVATVVQTYGATRFQGPAALCW